MVFTYVVSFYVVPNFVFTTKMILSLSFLAAMLHSRKRYVTMERASFLLVILTLLLLLLSAHRKGGSSVSNELEVYTPGATISTLYVGDPNVYSLVFDTDLNLKVIKLVPSRTIIWSTTLTADMADCSTVTSRGMRSASCGSLVRYKNGDVQILDRHGKMLWSTYTNMEQYLCCGLTISPNGIKGSFEIQEDGSLMYLHEFIEGKMNTVWRNWERTKTDAYVDDILSF